VQRSSARLAGDGEELDFGGGGLRCALAMACLGFFGKWRHDPLLDTLTPLRQLPQSVDRGRQLGLARLTAADIPDPDLAALEADGGAGNGHFTSGKRRATA